MRYRLAGMAVICVAGALMVNGGAAYAAESKSLPKDSSTSIEEAFGEPVGALALFGFGEDGRRI